jgi:transcriptional regulator with XRE-family HTH domain
MGITPGRLNKLETGQHTPDLSTLLRYTQAIGAQLAIVPKETQPWPTRAKTRTFDNLRDILGPGTRRVTDDEDDNDA